MLQKCNLLNLFFLYNCNMELFTEKEALAFIFEKEKKKAHFRIYKYRYSKGRLSAKTISDLLVKYRFITSQIALYEKAEQNTRRVKIELEYEMFELIFKSKLTCIEVDTEKYLITDKIEFIRFTYKKWYMDLSIRKVSRNENTVIHFNKIIDYNKPKQ